MDTCAVSLYGGCGCEHEDPFPLSHGHSVGPALEFESKGWRWGQRLLWLNDVDIHLDAGKAGQGDFDNAFTLGRGCRRCECSGHSTFETLVSRERTLAPGQLQTTLRIRGQEQLNIGFIRLAE